MNCYLKIAYFRVLNEKGRSYVKYKFGQLYFFVMFEFSSFDIEVTGKLLLAVLLGAIIGLERELHNSAAGVKTYAIVCLGATLFTLAAATVDIGVTSGVITGVGFLGAAMVFKSKSKVFGLTTAALIWATSAIGFAIGIGIFLGAIVATVLIFVILIPVEKMEQKFLKTHHQSHLKIKKAKQAANQENKKPI
jgi:putative Mg2+ transporter-C (MgtC) family protein